MNASINRWFDFSLKVLLFGAIYVFGLGYIEKYLIIYIPQRFSSLIAMTFSVLCSSFFLCKLIEKRDFREIGLSIKRIALKQFSVGFILAFIMISFIFLFEISAGYFKLTPFLEYSVLFKNAFYGFLIYAMVAVNEELLFRGYVFQYLIKMTNPLTAIITFSVIFSVFHLMNPNVDVLALINIVLAGIMFSVAYMRTNSLWMPIGLHLSWNYFQGIIYSFPVSGLTTEYSFFESSQYGPSFVTGGLFGPEAGIICTIILSVCIVYLFKSKNDIYLIKDFDLRRRIITE